MRSHLSLLAACLLLGVPALPAQTTRGTFISVLAGDTSNVEQYTRLANTVAGDLRFVKQGLNTHYAVTMRADGSAERAEVTNDSPDGPVTISYAFRGDSILINTAGAGQAYHTSLPQHGPVYAWIGASFALIEQVVRATLPRPGDSVTVSALNIRQVGNIIPVVIKRLTADSARVLKQTYVTISPQRDLLGALVKGSGLTVTRVPFDSTRSKLAAISAPPQPSTRRTLPVPGRDVGESPAGRPTVVLESGQGGGFDRWRTVQDSLATSSRVIAYERAGVGHAALSSVPRSANQIAQELHDLLRTIAAPPPYVLVGHSIGAIYVRAFANRYPSEVAGVVFVDGTMEEFMPWLETHQPEMTQEKYMPRVAADTTVAPGDRAEAAGWPATAAQLPGYVFPHVPTISLVGLRPNRFADTTGTHAWLTAQYDAARRLSIPEVRVSLRSAHYIHVEDPALVIAGVRDVLARIPQRP